MVKVASLAVAASVSEEKVDVAWISVVEEIGLQGLASDPMRIERAANAAKSLCDAIL